MLFSQREEANRPLSRARASRVYMDANRPVTAPETCAYATLDGPRQEVWSVSFPVYSSFIHPIFLWRKLFVRRPYNETPAWPDLKPRIHKDPESNALTTKLSRYSIIPLVIPVLTSFLSSYPHSFWPSTPSSVVIRIHSGHQLLPL